ncbi:MAG TPA: HAMP domain-containing protein, partial [Reyranella sp.]
MTKVTISLSAPRFGDRMSSIGRSLTGRIAAITLVVLAILAGTATYAWMANLVPGYFGTRGWMTGLLVFDLVIVLTLAAMLAGRITQIWLDRKRGAAGSRLHMRLVLLCSGFTVLPTLVVAIILALVFVNFTEYVVKPAQASFEAARAIGEPVRRARETEISSDIYAISAPLQKQGIDVLKDVPALTETLQRLLEGRPSMIEAIIVHADKGVIARAVAPGTEPIASPMPSQQVLWQAVNSASPTQMESPRGAYFVMQLFIGEPYFLVTGHSVDLRVVDYIKSIAQAGQFYAQIESRLERGQMIVFVVCGAIAFLMLLAAAWLAVLFATRLTAPIGGLMAAAEQMRGGDLSVRVEEGPPNDELGQLARSFNRMASQIEQQRGELIEANKELDTRRRLTDAVLAGVSA